MAEDKNKSAKKQSSNKKEISFLIPLNLFIILCILIVGINILKEIKKVPPTPPIPLPPEIKKIEKPKEKLPCRISIIIDDIGWNLDVIKEVEDIKQPLNLSVLPFTPYGEEIIEKLKNKNFEFMLHLPLEPLPPNSCLDKGAINTKMSEEEIREKFNADIEPLYSYVKGVNNHMGSLFTSNREKMEILLEEIKERNLFFIDSKTSSNSYGYSIAKKLGIPTGQRDVFLDYSPEEKFPDPEYIREQLYKLVQQAKKKGRAIGIGHPRKNTFEVLKNELPKIEEEGVKVVFVSTLVE